MENTSIAWTNHTWNLFRARNMETGKKGWMCEKVSRGCNFCYAETLNKRFGNRLEYNRIQSAKTELYMANPGEPGKYEKPSFVFVNSMTDTFWDAYPDKFRHILFDRIEAYPQHEFQLLTKRAREMYLFSKKRKFPKNAWAGVTIEDGSQIGRLDYLKKVQADIRWISMEPLLSDMPMMDLKGVHWVVTGGESGPHLWNAELAEKRALVVYNKEKKAWSPKDSAVARVEHIIANCEIFGTSLFHKQWGGALPGSAGRLLNGMEYNNFPRLPFWNM